MTCKGGFVALALASLIAVAGGCSGGTKSEGAKFCGDWAAAFCHRLYACTPAEMRDANFLGGSSESDCTAIWSSTCGQPPPAGVTFDINCSGGVHVNTAARAMCFDELSTIACDDFNSPTYVSVCGQVCGGGTGGGGIGGIGGAGGAGGRGGFVPPTNEAEFCRALQKLSCEIRFDCTPPAMQDTTFKEIWGATLQECEGTKTDAVCANYVCLSPYQAAVGTDCLDRVSAFSCADLNASLPTSCNLICPQSTDGSGGTGG